MANQMSFSVHKEVVRDVFVVDVKFQNFGLIGPLLTSMLRRVFGHVNDGCKDFSTRCRLVDAFPWPREVQATDLVNSGTTVSVLRTLASPSHCRLAVATFHWVQIPHTVKQFVSFMDRRGLMYSIENSNPLEAIVIAIYS